MAQGSNKAEKRPVFYVDFALRRKGPNVRRISLTALALLSLPLCASAGEFSTAPDFTLVTPDGQAVSLAREARTQPTIVLFWATWCPYCKALMPHLQSIRLEYGKDVKVLAIDIQDADGDPVAFMREAGYDFTLLPNGDAVAERYGVLGTPGLFIVDRHRNIRFDLRKLPQLEPPDVGSPAGNRRKAAYRAPFWAAEIRKSLDEVLANAD